MMRITLAMPLLRQPYLLRHAIISPHYDLHCHYAVCRRRLPMRASFRYHAGFTLLVRFADIVCFYAITPPLAYAEES